MLELQDLMMVKLFSLILYKSVETISVGSGGTGYTSTPTVTIADPTGPTGETATAFATVENESIASVTIISSGSQYDFNTNSNYRSTKCWC